MQFVAKPLQFLFLASLTASAAASRNSKRAFGRMSSSLERHYLRSRQLDAGSITTASHQASAGNSTIATRQTATTNGNSLHKVLSSTSSSTPSLPLPLSNQCLEQPYRLPTGQTIAIPTAQGRNLKMHPVSRGYVPCDQDYSFNHCLEQPYRLPTGQTIAIPTRQGRKLKMYPVSILRNRQHRKSSNKTSLTTKSYSSNVSKQHRKSSNKTSLTTKSYSSNVAKETIQTTIQTTTGQHRVPNPYVLYDRDHSFAPW